MQLAEEKPVNLRRISFLNILLVDIDADSIEQSKIFALSPTGSTLARTDLSPFARSALGLSRHSPAIVVFVMSAHVIELLSSWKTTAIYFEEVKVICRFLIRFSIFLATEVADVKQYWTSAVRKSMIISYLQISNVW